MTNRNIAAFIISLVSFSFLIPGVTLSMLSIRTGGTLTASEPETGMLARVKVRVFDTTNSILKTVKDLYQKDYQFVAIMIFIFSIVVPVIKGLILIYIIILSKSEGVRRNLFQFIKAIGKWSMCDVFIVAIFLAYLSSGARSSGTHTEASVMGFSVGVDVVVKMVAQLEIGFYCFLTYCLLSLIALQLYEEY